MNELGPEAPIHTGVDPVFRVLDVESSYWSPGQQNRTDGLVTICYQVRPDWRLNRPQHGAASGPATGQESEGPFGFQVRHLHFNRSAPSLDWEIVHRRHGLLVAGGPTGHPEPSDIATGKTYVGAACRQIPGGYRLRDVDLGRAGPVLMAARVGHPPGQGRREGRCDPTIRAATALHRKSRAFLPCRRQDSTTVRTRSTKRLPSWLFVPKLVRLHWTG